MKRMMILLAAITSAFISTSVAAIADIKGYYLGGWSVIRNLIVIRLMTQR